jgi:ribonucleoside-triphosphate reductase
MNLAKKRFGVIKDVTDKEYFTNSSHLPVDFKCDMQTKIDIEAPYHLLCNAGHIMYIEAGTSPKFNPQGVESVLKYMAKSGAVYGGINFVKDFCNKCHKDGTFEDGVCPYCGGTDIKRTAIITGYLSTEDRFNPGKQAELKARVGHAGGGAL